MPTLTGTAGSGIEKIRTLMANSASWQTWTGTANATAAKARVYVRDIPQPASGVEYTKSEMETKRPYARIDFAPRGSGYQAWKMKKEANYNWTNTHAICLDFFDDVASGDVDNPSDAFINFVNNVDSVISDMKTLSGTDYGGANTYTVLAFVVMLDPPDRVDETANVGEGDYYHTRYLIGTDWSAT